MRLLDLPDELLCTVLQHVSVFDKQRNLQHCCKRFWHLLKHPITGDAWGTVGVRLSPNLSMAVADMKALLDWLVMRKAGDLSTQVRLAATQFQLSTYLLCAPHTR